MGPLTERERWSFDINGYLVRRGALSAAEVARLHAAIDALGLPPAGDTIPSQRFKDHLHTDAAFIALVDHPAAFDVVVEVCGPGLRLDHAYGIRMAPGTSGLWLHGGGTPFDPAQWYLVRDGAISCGLVAVQWALCDHPAAGGGFACVPASHKASFPLPAALDADDPAVVEVALAAGDVVIFTEALTHGTRPWRQPTERRSLLYKYAPGHASWGKDVHYDASLWDQLSERQRKLFELPYVAYREPVR